MNVNMFATSEPFCAPVEGLPRQLGDYVVLKFLGEGAFGKVAKCLNSRTGEVVALKIFEDGVEEDAERELAVLQHLNNTLEPHKVNIIKYIDHFRWENYNCIAYEVLDCSLLDFSRQRRLPFSLSEIRPIAQQLLVAFEALKEAQVVHADLKPDNIMLVNHENQPFKVKLIDFGCGGFFSELEQGMSLMTDEYRAPEVTLGAPLSEALEMWSLGCCLTEGFLCCQLFSYTSSYDNLRTIIHLLGQPNDEMLSRSVYAEKFFLQTSSQWTFKTPTEYRVTNWKKPEMSVCPLEKFPNLEAALMHGREDLDEQEHLDLEVFVDFLKNLLQIDPENRLTASEALRHPFLSMEHLNNNSEYVRKARDLMSMTLQTSAPTLLEDGENSDQEQYPQHSSLMVKDHHCPPDNCHKMSSESKVTEANKEQNISIKIEKEDCCSEYYEVTDKKGLPRQLGDYVVQKFLGEGAFGKVAKCLNSRTGEVVALKIFEDGVEEDAERELAVLQHLNNTLEPHKVNIIKYIDHFRWENYNCIAYEVLDSSLLDFSRQRRLPFELNELRPIAQQLLVAFEALKEAQVVHTDLKPDNIMLVNHEMEPFKVKLIDFGCGGFFPELEQGSSWMPDAYRAPEVTLGAPLSEALEMWSLGCCLTEGFLRRQLFSFTSPYDNLRTIIHLLGQPSKEMLSRSVYADEFFLQPSSQWTFKTPIQYQATNGKKPKISVCPLEKFPNLEAAIMHGREDLDEQEHLDLEVFVDFLKNLLQIDPEKRLTASEALRHPFLSMEHLNNNSEYVRKARDLMSVTLQTSAPTLVENGAKSDQQQHPQPSAAATERPGSSLMVEDRHCPPDQHREITSEAEVKGANKEQNISIKIEEEDCSMEHNVVTDEENITQQPDQRLEEQLHCCSIGHTMDTHKDAAAPKHVVIEINELDTAPESACNSSSFWSAVRTITFGGVIALQAAACYAVSGSPLVAGVAALPMLIYGGIHYVANMDKLAS